MTLNEAIKYCEDFAMQKDKEAEEYNPRYTGLIIQCKNDATIHRQFVEWLKELSEVYAMIDGCSDYDELFVGYIRNRMKGKQFYAG